MLCQQGPRRDEKVEQMWHLFEVGRHVGHGAGEVDIVERHVDDVPNLIAGGAELAAARRGRWFGSGSH